MFTIIDKMIYPTLELLVAQLFGGQHDVNFASYRVPDDENQDFDNATQVYISIVIKEKEKV